MERVILVCGVSGSGKTWVCRQLTHKFNYVSHDDHREHVAEVIAHHAKTSDRPIIADCPFGERLLKEDLEGRGITVIPYFVIEPPEKVARRYREREGKPLPKSAYTRAITITQRADEWNAPRGTSEELLTLLNAL
jgi:hypothetical protein